jgi:hypothetical protein
MHAIGDRERGPRRNLWQRDDDDVVRGGVLGVVVVAGTMLRARGPPGRAAGRGTVGCGGGGSGLSVVVVGIGVSTVAPTVVIDGLDTECDVNGPAGVLFDPWGGCEGGGAGPSSVVGPPVSMSAVIYPASMLFSLFGWEDVGW